MTNYDIEMELESAQSALLKENGSVVNLSYWNPGEDYKTQVNKILQRIPIQDVFNYEYYFSESVKKEIFHKLGFSENFFKDSFLAAFPQSTHAIATLAAFFSRRNVKVGIVAPAYFSIQACLEDFKSPYSFFENFTPNFNEQFDVNILLHSDCEAFCFTSPINSTSVYLNSKVKDGIQKILDAGKWVVLDESLCVNGMELARTFGIQEKLLYVYSPHKALGLQGIKFSTVVANQDYYDEIDSLKDCYGGSLNAASQQGTSHFISKNFDECCQIYNGFWHENLVAVKQVLSAYDFAHFSEEMFGHYIMIFFDRSVNCKCFVEAMKQRMCKLGYSIYPGDMQGFDSSKKFCFRVNLLLNREDLVKGLSAILNFFKEERDQKW